MDTAERHHIDLGEKHIILIGTAHVSRESADLVEEVIETEKPDTVCVELCRSRYQWLLRPEQEQDPSWFDMIVGSRAGFTLPYLLFWYFQKKMGKKLGIRPGEDIRRAVETAKNAGAQLWLVDRDVRVTLERAWQMMSLKTKLTLFAQLALSWRDIEHLKAEDIERMKQTNVLEQAMAEFGESLPELRQVFIDERDQYMAQAIADAPGPKIVAVVGAAHAPGILRRLKAAEDLSTRASLLF